MRQARERAGASPESKNDDAGRDRHASVIAAGAIRLDLSHGPDDAGRDRHASVIAAGAIRLDLSHGPDDAPEPPGPGGCLPLSVVPRTPPNHTPSAVPGHRVTRPRTVNPRKRGSSASLRPPGR